MYEFYVEVAEKNGRIDSLPEANFEQVAKEVAYMLKNEGSGQNIKAGVLNVMDAFTLPRPIRNCWFFILWLKRISLF